MMGGISETLKLRLERDNQNLMRCPFCGSRADIRHTFGCTYPGCYFVMCRGCGMSSDNYSSSEKALTAWNNRVLAAV